MKPILYIARHGHTNLNGDPGTSSERIRGWSDVSLDSKGRAQAEKMGKKIAEQDEITHIVSSDLRRAKQTARIIAQHIVCCNPVTTDDTPDLRPWDLGNMTGSPLDDSVTTRMEFHEKYPDIPVKEGESFRTFYDRWVRVLHKYILLAENHPDNVYLLIAHSRHMLSLSHAIRKAEPTLIPVKGGPGPGAVVKVSLGGNTYHWKEII